MMERVLNKKVLVGAIAAAALVGGGGAIAATQFSGGENERAIIDDAAKRLGVQPAELESALREALAARVDAAVAAGRLTEEQGRELKERIAAGELPILGGPFGGHHHGAGIHAGLDAAATYLGLSEEQLRTELESGKSLADIATAKGKSVDGLKQALLDEADTQLAQAVEDGKLTEAQKQEMLARLEERIDDIVNGTFLGRHGRHHFDERMLPPDETQPGYSGTVEPASI